MATISVIVPVYKVEQFLHRCVDSILGQTFSDFELILVDDGSPDSCGAICEDYARQDSRIHVIHQENGGLSAARNTGIDWVFAGSDSQWLAFVDSDDWVHPAFLERLYAAATENNCRISACGFFKTSGGPFPEDGLPKAQVRAADDFYCAGDIQPGLIPVAWNKLYHRSLFETLRYPHGKLHEDEFTTYQAVYQAGTVAFTPARLYAYYQNPQGIMLSQWKPGRLHILEAFEQQIAFAQAQKNDRLLCKVARNYILSLHQQLEAAVPEYHAQLRKKYRAALKLGRHCGVFPGKWENLWAYEEAYPCKLFWWPVFQVGGLLRKGRES